MNDRPNIQWTAIKEFEENGILVEVSQSDGRRPRYNVRVGRRGERGVIPFMALFMEGQGTVLVTSIAGTVEKLLAEAEEFVRALGQEAEDKYIAERLAREERDVAREGKKRRPSGYRSHKHRGDRP